MRPAPAARFNPRPREGGDERRDNTDGGRSSFQSAPPRGGRPPNRPASSRPRSSFNPRPREGGDGLVEGVPLTAVMFQSAPPRGGRPDTPGEPTQ